MEKSIWKYPVSDRTHFTLSLPQGAEILSVQIQHGKPQLWALVSPQLPTEDRRFCIVGTGWDFDADGLKFIGTFQQSGGAFVLHLFEQDE